MNLKRLAMFRYGSRKTSYYKTLALLEVVVLFVQFVNNITFYINIIVYITDCICSILRIIINNIIESFRRNASRSTKTYITSDINYKAIYNLMNYQIKFNKINAIAQDNL